MPTPASRRFAPAGDLIKGRKRRSDRHPRLYVFKALWRGVEDRRAGVGAHDIGVTLPSGATRPSPTSA